VADISHPDFRQHIAKVDQVLSELGALDRPTLMIFNKIDKLPPTYSLSFSPRSDQEQGRMFVSAKANIGVAELARRITGSAKGDWTEAWLFLDNGRSNLLPRVYKTGVVTESRFDKDGIRLRIRGKREDLQKLRRLDRRLKLQFVLP